MKTLNTIRIATKGLIIILSGFVIFHLLILLGIIPYKMVWGGRLNNAAEMISFEVVSIIVNILMLVVVRIYAGSEHVGLKSMIVRATLWLMAGVFLLNTIGNFLSVSEWEKWVFTPLTLLLCLFSLRLAISKKQTIFF